MNKAFTGADILLPKPEVQMEKWAVVACDQFTSEPDYWEETEKIVKEAPSTLRLILPEVYLEEEGVLERLAAIKEAEKEYLRQGIWKEYQDAMIYVERLDSKGRLRKGLIGKIDLEQYDYRTGSSSLVRATEATVPERIPPRLKVRKEAVLEFPHIMLLLDDRKRQVIEPLAEKKENLTKIYDFSLMQEGGSIQGYLLGRQEQKQVEEALQSLQKDMEEIQKDANPLLFGMGDGNHSLATAKAFYEELKKENPQVDFSNHPARYALVELVNLHSSALKFKAIHRLVTKVETISLMEKMTEELGLVRLSEGTKTGEHWEKVQESTTEKREKELEKEREKELQIISLCYQGKEEKRVITKPSTKLAVGSVQNFLDQYLKKYPGKIDYVHGEGAMRQLTKEEDTLGILFEDMKKENLFPAVMADGALPRKTFSMGHAKDKRYYLEGRRIR